MVKDHVLRPVDFNSIYGLSPLVPRAHAQIADDDVVGVDDVEGGVAQTDTVPGRGLSRNGEVWLRDLQIGLKRDCTGDAEDNGAISFPDSVPQRTGAIIVQVGDGIDLAAAASGGKPSPTLGTGKCQRLCGDDKTGQGDQDEGR